MERRGLEQPTWMQSLKDMTAETRSGGKLTGEIHQNARDILQTANEGDFVSIEELKRSEQVMQIIKAMPETLQESVLNNEKVVEYDYIGNPQVVKNTEISEAPVAAD
jgi:hypothetical protein